MNKKHLGYEDKHNVNRTSFNIDIGKNDTKEKTNINQMNQVKLINLKTFDLCLVKAGAFTGNRMEVREEFGRFEVTLSCKDKL